MQEPRMTKEEFEGVIREWGREAKADMASILRSKTHGTGQLQKISVTVGESKKTTSHYAGFRILRYGVYVAYGVGRGWIRQNGKVVRGSRVKKYSEMWYQMRKKGYTSAEISKHAVGGSTGEGRKPVDWFDAVLIKKIGQLADLAADYYGDYTQSQMLDVLNRATIKKNYTTSDL